MPVIDEVEKTGLSLEGLDGVVSQLGDLGFPLEEVSRQPVDQLQSSVNERKFSLS